MVIPYGDLAVRFHHCAPHLLGWCLRRFVRGDESLNADDRVHAARARSISAPPIDLHPHIVALDQDVPSAIVLRVSCSSDPSGAGASCFAVASGSKLNVATTGKWSEPTNGRRRISTSRNSVECRM